jgi:hypothetical protein
VVEYKHKEAIGKGNQMSDLKIQKMLDLKTRFGGSREDAMNLLNEMLNTFKGDNLELALQYWGFTK